MRFLLVSALVFLQHSALYGEWTSQVSGTTQSLFGVYFIDESRGWTVGYNGTILHTTDGGTTWSPQVSGTITMLRDVHFVDANTGWAVGGTGLILHTTNAGAAWLRQLSGTTDSFEDICFVDAITGWAVGSGGTILHTTDAGATWIPQASGTLFYLTSVHFTDAETGWVVGLEGTIRRTTNGGITWSGQAGGTTVPLWDVYFTDPHIGWIVGIGGTIRHTTNGGTTWVAQTSGTTTLFFDVYFADENRGWIVGGEGTILHTTDGGATWFFQTSGVPYYLTGVQFTDVNTGWASGLGGTILHHSKDEIPCEDISEFQSRCSGSGTVKARIILGSTDHTGETVAFTIDSEIYEAFVETRGSVSRAMISAGGYSVGTHTVALTEPAGCFDPIVVNCQPPSEASDDGWDDGAEEVSASILLGNYPNPFNPATTFEFSIPHSLFANLSVYNLLGEKVATVIDEQLPAGTHTVHWDATGQPSGGYFYRLQAGEFTETRKLVLLR